MRMNDDHNILLPVLTAAMLLLNSCGTTPPSRFYTLEAMPANESIQSMAERKIDVHIGVGPVEFADYLDRSQIVTRTNDNEVNLAETHRWAEPLHNNFGRVLAENLSILLNTDKISLHPSRNWSVTDYQVLVHVWQFDASKQGKVTLTANWTIREKGSPGLLTIKKSTFNADVEATASYSDIVHALSKTVELLSREIASVIANEQDI